MWQVVRCHIFKNLSRLIVLKNQRSYPSPYPLKGPCFAYAFLQFPIALVKRSMKMVYYGIADNSLPIAVRQICWRSFHLPHTRLLLMLQIRAPEGYQQAKDFYN